MCISILARKDREEGIESEETFMALTNYENEYVLKQRLLHLHRQYGHQYEETKTKFLRNFSHWKHFLARILKEINKSCKICVEFCKDISKPVVKISITTDFNEEVCIDMKDWKVGNYKYILYMNDSYT